MGFDVSPPASEPKPPSDPKKAPVHRGRRHFWEYFNKWELEEFFAVYVEILEEHSPKAQGRRRDTTSSVGITGQALLDELLKRLPWMRKYNPNLSRTSVLHAQVPHHAGRATASAYASVIDARAARSENDLHEDNPLVLLQSFPSYF